MRKLYSVLIGAVFSLVACSDFTEIAPKGKSVLNRVEDLDWVLNYRYNLSCTNMRYLVNDIYPNQNIPNLLDEPIKTLTGIYVSWDEETDRASLTNTDSYYTELYTVIGRVANPVLENIDNADGDETLARQLKAEALVLRGWCHYMLVNAYAKAYDPATAETDPGIVYAMETDPTDVPNEKLTVAEVYDRILADIDSALNMGSLPVMPAHMRVGLPFAYAAKAKVLMSMRDYDGAFEAAEESLSLKNTIDDYNDLIGEDPVYIRGVEEFLRPLLELEEELFETPEPFYYAFTTDLWNAFEEHHVVADYILTDLRYYGEPLYASTYGYVDGVYYILSNSIYYSPIGLTTVDMYLTQAECYIREGNVTEAMRLLNLIRENRIARDYYEELTASTPEEAFAILKNVSRTENFATPKNYINLKRWNTEEAYRETLRRVIDWTVYTRDEEGEIIDSERFSWSGELAPDSPLWIFPFPQNATTFNPNLTQNYETEN